MATTEKRTLNIEARLTDKFTQPLSAAERAIIRFGTSAARQLRGVVSNFVSVRGAVAGLAAAYAGIASVSALRNVADDAASMARLAAATGDTTANLSELRGALKLGGVEAQAFESALRAIVKVQAEAAGGNTKALDTFKQLGITLQDLQTLGPSQLFEQITEGLERFGDQQQRTLAVAKKLPEALQPLLPVLTQGIDRFQQLVRDARGVGATITDQEARGAQALSAGFDKVQISLEAVSRSLIAAFGPDVAATLDRIAHLIANNRQAVVDLAKALGSGLVAAVEGAITAIIGLVATVEKVVDLAGLKTVRLELKAVEQQLQRIRGIALDPTDIQTTAKHLVGLTEDQLLARKAELETVLTQGLAGSMRAALAKMKQEIDSMRAQIAVDPQPLTPNQTAGALGMPTLSDWDAYRKAMDEAMGRAAEQRASVFQQPPASSLRIPTADDGEAGIGRERQRLAIMQQIAALGPDLEAVQRAQDEIGRRSMILTLQEAKDQGVINADELAAAVERVNAHFAEMQQVFGRGDFGVGFAQGAKEAAAAWTNFGEAGRQAAQQIIDGGLNGVTDALTDVLTGARSAKDAFRDLARSIIQDIARMIVKLLVMAAVMAALGIPPGVGFAAISSANQVSSGGGGGFFGPGFEKGGAVGRALAGTVPLRKFDRGGVVREPTLALFGEGRASRGEAFVPLPDGRRIPVALSGGGGVVHNTFTINAMDGASVERVFMENKELLRAMWVHDAGHYRDVRQTIQGAAR